MTISEQANLNFKALTEKTMTAKDMALTSHNLCARGVYARLTSDSSLWIWSDLDFVWKQIDTK